MVFMSLRLGPSSQWEMAGTAAYRESADEALGMVPGVQERLQRFREARLGIIA